MPRKAKVVTTSFFGVTGSTADENRELACTYVDIAGREGADMVCLPEDFLRPRSDGRLRVNYSEPLSGPTFERLAALARTHRIWIVACYSVETGPDQRENSAVVIDRDGQLAARYAKIHPTIGECRDSRITPGGSSVVVETDFGRVGLAICYDIGWPDHWADLARKGAEMVVWPSAYDGGFPLQVYAWTHFYHVVSAVRSEHSKVIDITGRVITQTSKYHRLAAATIDLEKEVFHTDAQAQKLIEIERELGPGVTIDALSQENVFTVESNDAAWPLSRIKERWGLENFRDYHRRATAVQDEDRQRDTAVVGAE
ncbi:MAG TPA: carbon-nitrogen hydrolase family protein [Candidatus Dormibacteraeota bacterium]|nr:carbon-nitrogen hydrolase family protein [Candidatus Dormibacteraeota bacterium]